MLEQNEALIRKLCVTKPKDYKIVPDFRNNISKFNGKVERHEAESWLTALKGIAELHDWPQELKLEAARSSLVGPAKDWYYSKKIASWAEFEEKFLRTYIGEIDMGSKWKEMLKRCQCKNEDTEDYLQEKIRMCRGLGLSIKEIKLQVIEGLWNKNLSDHLLAISHTDEDQLRDSIVTYERVNQARVTRIRSRHETQDPGTERRETSERYIRKRNFWTKSPTEENSARDVTKQSSKVNRDASIWVPKCYICGKQGHISRECRQASNDRQCRKCGKTGHLAKDCDRKQQMTLAKDNCEIRCSKYLKPMRINQKGRVYGLIDTGASDCTIRESAVKDLSLVKIPLSVKLTGFGEGEQSTEVKEAVLGVIEIEGVLGIETRILVVADGAQAYDVIVGRSWLDQPHVAYYSVDNNLKIGYREEDPFRHLQVDEVKAEINIKAMEQVNLPASSINLVEVVAGTETFQVLARNDSSAEVEIDQGTILGRGSILAIKGKELLDHCEIGLKRKILPEELNIGLEITREQKEQLTDLLNEYPKCFADNTSEIGLTHLTEMEILEEPGSKPVQMKPYKASHHERTQIAEIVKEWKDAELITETKSPYASPVLLVKKKNGDARLVVDYRRLNKQTITQTYPMPDIDSQLETLAGAELFVTLDLAHGYLQVPLSESAKQKTAFITPDEHLQFERMVFGLKNAPYEFTRVMSKALGQLRNHVVLCYLDDMLIPAKDWLDMLIKLKSVLEALQSARLTLRLPKCHFGKAEVEYLGFNVSRKGIRPGNQKTEVIANYPEPKDAQEIRRFIGLTSFFRRFVPQFARLAAPLTSLTKKNIPFQWNKEQQIAFQALKDALIKEPVLQLYNPKAETQLHTDASMDGLAGMLLQVGNDGKLHLVYSVSKRTSDAERNYHSSRLELLAIVWSVERLRQFLINIPFTVVTDCQALIYLNSSRTKNSQICRWYNQLQEYNFQVKYRPGSKMKHVDALSRALPHCQDNAEVEPIGEMFTFISREEEVRLWQLTDEKLQILGKIMRKPPEERSLGEKQQVENVKLISGILYKTIGGRELLMVPTSFRKSLAVKAHDLTGHFGLERTLENIARHYWFASMRRYLKNHINSCIQCVLNKIPSGKKKGELHPIPPGKRPFAVVHIDHLGPFIRSRKGNQHLLVITDNLTRFVRLRPVKDVKTRTTLKHVQKFIADYGTPEIIISDRGTAFTSQQFQEFCKTTGMKHNLVSVRHPRANGMVERVNRTVLPVIRTLAEKEDGSDWDVRMDLCEQALNSSVNRITGKTPYEALLGFQPRFVGQNTGLGDFLTSEYTRPEKMQEDLRKKVIEAQKGMKKTFDAKVSKAPSFDVGDLVFIRRATEYTGRPTKTQPRYKGPMVITAKRGGDSYVVSDLEEKDGRCFATSVHVNDIKLWKPEMNEEDMLEDDCDELQEESDTEAKVVEGRGTRRRRIPAHLKDYDL